MQILTMEYDDANTLFCSTEIERQGVYGAVVMFDESLS